MPPNFLLVPNGAVNQKRLKNTGIAPYHGCVRRYAAESNILTVSTMQATPKLRRRMLKGSFLKAMLEPIVPTTITAMTQERRQTKIWKEIYQNSLKSENYKPSFFLTTF